jgi:small subunit ribosomal protein S4e
MTHLKSLAAPRYCPKRETVFVVSPRTGPHPKHRSIPLLVAVRDILGYAEDGATGKKLIKAGKFLVDQRVVKDHRFPLGLMDVLSVPDYGEHYRVLMKPGKGVSLFKITAEEAGFKVCQVLRKNHVKGGGLALGLHDGRTILYRGERVEEGRSHSVLDSVKIALPSQEVIEWIPLEVNTYGYIHSGGRAGLHGKIFRIRRDVVFPDKPTGTIEVAAMGSVTTLLRNIMPVGGEKPWLTLP